MIILVEFCIYIDIISRISKFCQTQRYVDINTIFSIIKRGIVAKLSKPNEPMDGDIKVRIGNLNFQGTLRKAGNRDNCMTFDILLNDSNNNRFMGHLLLNEHSEGNNSEFPQIHASSRMQKDEEDTDEEAEHIKKFQIPHTEYHKSLQTKVSEAEIQNGHWINEKKLEPQQFSWKYQEGTNITPKKQNQRWTHISFVGDTMLVNRDKFNDYSPYLGIEIPKMVTGERTVNEKFPVSKESQST